MNDFLNAAHNVITKVNDYSGIIGTIIAIAALILSVQSYRISMQKADLHLSYMVYDSGQDNPIMDGKGSITFFTDGDTDPIGIPIVTITRPGGEMDLTLENTGKVAAKNVVLDIQFINMSFNPEYLGDGWKAIDYMHGYIGNCTRIRWEPGGDLVLHPGLPVRFQEMSFSGAVVDKNAQMVVILSADNAPAQKFTIPVEIKNC